MFWADRIAQEVAATKAAQSATSENPLIVRDEKTISGRVHVGSMRGVAIHGLMSEVLLEQGIANSYLYELNDFDPFDSIPPFLSREEFLPHLGKPLFLVPSPEPGFANFAEYFAAEFVAVHKKAGFYPSYYWLYKDVYQAGKMDELIRVSLEHAADIRRIMKEVSGSQKDESWLPVSIVCERCQKMMTTRAHDFDGETVGYSCDKSPEDIGACGYEGRVAPWGGAAKLFWKADWAAKWVVMNVGLEGAGKDHSTKGGSRDVSRHIAKEVFGIEEPFDVPYEFFLVGGKKMSSSKGRGSSAKDISDLFPPAVFRLVLLGKDINQQIDVDPAGDSVPRMYDWYDDLAELVRNGVSDDFTRLFALIQVPNNQATPPTPWMMRFSQVAFIVQMPHMNLADEAARAKGAVLTDEESLALEERASYARFWLATYAPEEYRFVLQEIMPEVALTDVQKKACGVLADYMSEQRTGEELHARLHELKSEVPIAPKELFSALYKIFLARESGPKAGWFLSVLPREFVEARLREAAA